MEYLDQDKRIEIIELVYELINKVNKTTKKDLNLVNIATSYHNQIVDIEKLFKENNNDFKSSLLYMIINTYLTNKLIEGTKTLKELAENTNKDEFMTIGKFLKKYNTTKTLIEDYKNTEKDIRYFNIEESIEKIFKEREDFGEIPSNVIEYYNNELKNLGINKVISNKKTYQKTKHIR